MGTGKLIALGLGMLVLAAGAPQGRAVARPQGAGAAVAVGELLVARAEVPDARFARTVVLVVSRTAAGTAGLVLNHRGEAALAGLFPDVAAAAGRGDTAFVGGPVAPAQILCLLRTSGPLHEAAEVLPGVFVSSSLELMGMAFNAQQPASAFRVFQGYAGWKPGQLERELAAGAWTVQPGAAATVFDPDPATLWQRLSAPAPLRHPSRDDGP